jgi:hypothetical protein
MPAALPTTKQQEHDMSESKQASGRPEGRPDNTNERARIEAVCAVGEVLDEQSLRMVAGGLPTSAIWTAVWDLATMKP